MNNIATSIHRPGGRLLSCLLGVCLVLAAVPALAECCADRCHADAPAEVDHCDCSLAGMEPPRDLMPLATDPDDAEADAHTLDLPSSTPTPPATPSSLVPPGLPDRSTVLLI
jgi:hypothetical protein